MEAVGRAGVIDQGRAISVELCCITGLGRYIRRLGGRHPGNDERGGRKDGPHLASEAIPGCRDHVFDLSAVGDIAGDGQGRATVARILSASSWSLSVRRAA